MLNLSPHIPKVKHLHFEGAAKPVVHSENQQIQSGYLFWFLLCTGMLSVKSTPTPLVSFT